MSDRRVDRITGGVGAGLSICYLLYARGIEDSLLADNVGANGVPIGVAGVLLLASLALFGKSWVEPVENKTSPAASELPNPSVDDDNPVLAQAGKVQPHRMALVLLAILASYVMLLPMLGYVLSIGLLVGSVAWLAGARQRVSVLMSMLAAGPVLWLMFDWALEIRLPVGLWPMLLAS